MRTKMVVMCVAALMLAFCPAVFAAGQEGKLGLGARVGYSVFQGDDFSNNGRQVDVDFDSCPTFGIDGTYWLSDMFSLELAVEYVTTATDAKTSGKTVDMGDLTQIPILLTFQYHPFTFEGFSPYVGVGAGYYINDFDTSDAFKALATGGKDLEVDSNAGFHACLGTDYFVNDTMAVNLDVRYAFNSTKFKTEGSTSEETIDLNAYTVKLGFKYFF